MKTDKWQSFVFLMILSVIWGSSFILIKKGLLAFHPGQVASLRIVISGLVFLPYVLLNLKKIPLEKMKYILAFGVLEIGIPPYLYSIAQTSIDSSTAGILNSLVPLFTLLTGFLFYRLAFSFAKLAGVLIGLVGAVLLVFARTNGAGSGLTLDFANAFGLLIVLATVMYGFGSNILKTHLQEVPGLATSAFSFVAMSIPAGIYLLTTDIFQVDMGVRQNYMSFLAISALSLFGSALAIYLFTLLVQKSNALFGSFVTYLIPFVALGWGFLDGEPLNFIQILCLISILGGIFIANEGRASLPALFRNRNSKSKTPR